MKFITSAAFVLLFTTVVFCQEENPGYKDYFMEGSYLLLEDEPEQALKNFRKAYALDSSSANINYMMGIASMEVPSEKANAEYYLSKAVTKISKRYKSDDANEKSAPPLAHFYYGKALHFNYKFDEAKKEFEAFQPTVNPKDIEYVKMLDKELRSATVAKQLTTYPLNVKITNLGSSINSEFPEYGAVLSGDERTIIYTTRRPDNSGKMVDSDGSAFEDIVVSYKDNEGKWSTPAHLGINSIGHEAAINLSADGQTLIVYKNEPSLKMPGGNGNLYYAVYDGKDWSSLEEFGSDVNTLYVESHACLSADGNLLFFSSERPGGFGGKDIYRCIKLPNGKWSKALNMGPLINTEYDEDGGFIHPDGQTFYFASNGPGSMGGYDILYATLNEENKFTNVTNIGYPINTTDDDIFYVVSPDGKRGYFASASSGGFGDKDLYQITMEETRETFLALFKGQILPADGEDLPSNISIVVTDKETNEVIGIYRPKVQNGTFSTILPPGKQYTFSYQINQGEEFYSEEIFVSNEYAYQEIKREVNLEPVKIAGKIKVIKNTIELNIQVLNNPKEQKPVAGAHVVLQEIDGGKQVFTTNEEGRTEMVLLTADKKYQVGADIDDKKSDLTDITTVGVTAAKKANEVIYLEGKEKTVASKNLLLDLKVTHPKTKQAIADANVSLVNANGDKTELVSNKKGQLIGLELVPNTTYTVMAYKENAASEVITFTTGAAGKPVKFNKNILLAYSVAVPVDSTGKIVVTDGRFEFFYKYGQKVIDENEESYTSFINELAAALKTGNKITVYITGAASKVPMRAAGGNKKLAADRASAFKTMIELTLKNKGVDLSNIVYSISSGVSGPDYAGDYIVSRKLYEKYQYVKAAFK